MSEARSTRPVLYGILALLVAFLAGVGVGRLLPDGPGSDVEETVTMRPPSAGLFEDLGLTPAQEQQIDSILSTMRLSTDSMMDEVRGDLTGRATAARRAIESVLNPDQRATLAERFQTLGPLMIRRVRLNDTLIRVDTIQ